MTCKFLDLVRKWHHNPDDSTDIIFRLILSALPFSLKSSCVIHHLLWHLFFAAQFQGQMSVFTIKVWICWCTLVFFLPNFVPRVLSYPPYGARQRETLENAGHVSPRIWEITNKRFGGGASNSKICLYRAYTGQCSHQTVYLT